MRSAIEDQEVLLEAPSSLVQGKIGGINMQVGIIGAGHAGLTLFARLCEIGERPKVYSDDQHSSILSDVMRSDGRLLFENKLAQTKYVAKINCSDITSSIEDLVTECDLLFNTTPINAHGAIFDHVLRAIKVRSAAKAYINLGGGFSIFDQILKIRSTDASIDLGTLHTLPFASRVVGASATLLNIRAETSYAFYGSHRDECVSLLKSLFPSRLIRDENILHMSLDRSSYVMHPLILIFNANRIDNGEKFYFYANGFTSSIKSLLIRSGYERSSLARTLGFIDYPDPEARLASFEKNYGEDFKNIRPLSSLNHRYIFEDIPYGLVPICGLGRVFGIPMPVCHALVEIASSITGLNFWDSPYNLTRNPVLLSAYAWAKCTMRKHQCKVRSYCFDRMKLESVLMDLDGSTMTKDGALPGDLERLIRRNPSIRWVLLTGRGFASASLVPHANVVDRGIPHVFDGGAKRTAGNSVPTPCLQPIDS